MATKKTTVEEPKLNIPLDNVMAKLQTARVMLQEKGLSKSGKNTFANFEYFQLKDFLPEVNRIFARLGLFSKFQLIPKVIATTTGEDIREIAELTIYDIQKPEDKLTFEMEVAQLMIGNNSKQNLYQAAGGRSTYYKRYLYRDALEIEESDEVDAVLGQEGVNYQPYVPESPVPTAQPVQPTQEYVTVTSNGEVYGNFVPQEKPIQQEPTAAELAQKLEQNSAPMPVEEDPEATLSEDCRMYVMNEISRKNGDAFALISAYCQEQGIASPDQLKNKHFEGLVRYIEAQ